MKILKNKNLFKLGKGKNTCLCITTNGKVKKNGLAVMGAGIALHANKRFKLDEILGKKLQKFGNHVFDLGIYGSGFHIASFPTKNHWRGKSSKKLIEQSAVELVELADKIGLTEVYLPKPGCQNGHLNWEDVLQIIEKQLDDRFTVIINDDKRIENDNIEKK
ncbi:hypothetical protein H8356DRAFT_1086906 [Neocallimastix lanati (nom. inval.)]|uniref:ADP-ribose 1''-phosphate phosphatase n=1 Tax=Neocallimastix californiae TaxID=1754190 RepID=A0A1Y2CKK4_9FUNG|nr:hypothetical protein H8356DRAFT_1086906 [Neocallimastix sp. JGI-2020a]ORY47549.1 hypothetical protein LY90DRAFT_9897 [Neocallimastix californiae]|eukprot:ORY47549.1 hypothetical protein LY90DRAFT_9897 [Neocallimastix californiae]